MNTDKIRAEWPLSVMKTASKQVHRLCDVVDVLTRTLDEMTTQLVEARIAALEAEKKELEP